MTNPYDFILPFFACDLSCQLLRLIATSQGYGKPIEPTNHFTHVHPFWELHYVSRDHCSYSTGDALYEVGPNQLLIIPPDTEHTLIRNPHRQHQMLISMHIQPPIKGASPNAHALYHALLGSTPILLDVPPDSMLFDALQHIDLLAEVPPEARTFSILESVRSYAGLLMAALSEALAEPADTAPIVQPLAPHELLLDQFFCYPSSMCGGATALARMLHVSPRQLDRIMQERYGINFREKLRQTKLNYATDLLADQSLSIDRIALLLQFSSSAAFCTFIKKETGKTPTQLRRALSATDPSA